MKISITEYQNFVGRIFLTIFLMALLHSTTYPQDSLKNAYNQTGFVSYKLHCGICHSIKAPAKEGPPLQKVLKIYSEKYPDSSQFVERVFRWVKHPQPGSSLMISDVMQHQLMPKLPYTDNTIYKIAVWMWQAAGCQDIPDAEIEPDLGSC